MNCQRIIWVFLLMTILELWIVIDGIQAVKGRQKERVSRAISGRELYRKVSHIHIIQCNRTKHKL